MPMLMPKVSAIIIAVTVSSRVAAPSWEMMFPIERFSLVGWPKSPCSTPNM